MISLASPADELRYAWDKLVVALRPAWGSVTPQDEASALVSLLLNLSVRELQRTDNPAIRESMIQLADRLRTLAETPAAQLDAVAQFLADVPRAGITRQ